MFTHDPSTFPLWFRAGLRIIDFVGDVLDFFRGLK